MTKTIAFTKPRHKWTSPVTCYAEDTSTHCEQSERTCEFCGLVRITVHPPQGFPWREWRNHNASFQYLSDGTPPCEPHGEVKAM